MDAAEESIPSKTEYGILERISIAVTGFSVSFWKGSCYRFDRAVQCSVLTKSHVPVLC